MTDTYEKNLAVLRSCFPDVHARIAGKAQVLPFPVETYTDAAGHANARCVSANGRIVSFYEEDDIVGHFNKQCADWHLGGTDFLFCIGMGLGYLPLAVSQTIDSQPWIVVFEPRAEVLDLALRLVDLRVMLQYPKLDLIIASGLSVSEHISKYQDRIFFGKSMLISHGPSRIIFGEPFEALEKELVDNIQLVRNKSYTAKQAGKQILANTLANLPSIFSGPDLNRIKNLFNGCPAFCVAAGPSLDKDIAQLKTIGNRAAILCCDSAVHALAEAGIHPHMIVTADRNPVNYEKIRHDMNHLRESVLVFGAEANPDNVRAFLGARRFAVSADSVLLNRWLGPRMGLDWQLPAMTSVSHAAIFTAMILGADPIVLVGMDFAYATGRSHSQASVFRYRANNNAMIAVDGVRGGPVDSLPQLIADRRQIENTIVDKKTRFIDVSLDGALIRGTQVRPLEEVVQTMLKKDGDVSQRLNSVGWHACAKLDDVIETLESMAAEVKEFRKCCSQQHSACLSLCTAKRVKRVAAITKIRNDVARYEKRYDLVLRILKLVRYADIQALTDRLEKVRTGLNKPGLNNTELMEEIRIYADHYDSLDKAGAWFERLLTDRSAYFGRERCLTLDRRNKSQSADTLLVLADHYRDNNELWKAEQAYRHYLDGSPENPAVWLALGTLYADKGLWSIAHDFLIELKNRHAFDGDVKAFEKRIGQQMAEIIDRGSRFLRDGETEKARRCLLEYLSIFPEDENALAFQEKLRSLDVENEKRLSNKDGSSGMSSPQPDLLEKARLYIKAGQSESAIGILEGLAEAIPDQAVQYREWVGDIRCELNDHAGAAWHYRKALDGSGENQALEKKLQASRCRQASVHADIAHDPLEKDQPVERYGPQGSSGADPDRLCHQAQELASLGQLDKAIETLEHLLSEKPDFALAHNDLGVLFFNQGNPNKAEEHYHAATRIDPYNLTFQKNLADFTYAVRGNVRGALKIYVKLLNDHPEDIEILSSLGQICANERQYDDAEFFLRRALEIDPDNDSVQRSMTELFSITQRSI